MCEPPSFQPLRQPDVAAHPSRGGHPVVRLVVLAMLCLLSPQLGWAQAVLENPQPDSFQSGIGIISGWACNAASIEIQFNNLAPVEAAYGTSRGDTRGPCGDTDNGFGLPFNWNLLSDGAHTVRALADGVEFARVEVEVTTLGTEFVRGASGEFTLNDFPAVGSDVVVRWQEAQQNFVITDGQPSRGGGTGGSPPFVLENPAPGSFQSGIGLISGWACDAGVITLQFDNLPPVEAAYGTSRGDTQGACGDTDNGFGLLVNWNLLGNGLHTVRALADEVEFASVEIVVTTLGTEFLRGASGEFTLDDFPEVGTDVVIQWQETQQNFVIIEVGPTERLVTVHPTLTLPAAVTSVQRQDVEITSLVSPTAQVRANLEPTLLRAEDAGGAVLLSIADMDGGFLEEPGNEVEVGIASTAITLVALAAGYSIPDINQSVVDQIVAHARYPMLLAELTTLLNADKNFLTRLFDYPAIVSRIREVATFRFGTQPATASVVVEPFQTLADQSLQESILPLGIRKDGFWCKSGRGWVSLGFCSPWRAAEPWIWFGEAQGIRAFVPDTLGEIVATLGISFLTGGLLNPASLVTALGIRGYYELLAEATHPPFLARALRIQRRGDGTPYSLHATANPNFVTYAMELYDEEPPRGQEFPPDHDPFKGWLLTPGNGSILDKMRNSGASYRGIETGRYTRLNPDIDRIRFERYRFTARARDGGLPDHALALSFLNTFTAFTATTGVLTKIPALERLTKKLKRLAKKLDDKLGVGAGEALKNVEEYRLLVACGTALVTSYRFPETQGRTLPQYLVDFIEDNIESYAKTLGSCLLEARTGLSIKFDVEDVNLLIDIGAWLTGLKIPKLIVESANEAVPILTSYFAPGAGSVDYYLKWRQDRYGPYIAAVSKTALSDVRFQYRPGFLVIGWEAVEGARWYTIEDHLDARIPESEKFAPVEAVGFTGTRAGLLVSPNQRDWDRGQLRPGQRFCFSVKALDENGVKIHQTAPVCIPAPDLPPPLPPGQRCIPLPPLQGLPPQYCVG